MRLTLEPTIHIRGDMELVAPKVLVEKPSDDLDVYQVTEMFKAALIAYGFHPNSVEEVFDNDVSV